MESKIRARTQGRKFCVRVYLVATFKIFSRAVLRRVVYILTVATLPTLQTCCPHRADDLPLINYLNHMYVESNRISRIHVESGADLEKLEIVRIMASRWVYR